MDLKNVTFLKKDAWLGQDMTMQVGQMTMDADKLEFIRQYVIEINSLVVDRPVSCYV